MESKRQSRLMGKKPSFTARALYTAGVRGLTMTTMTTISTRRPVPRLPRLKKQIQGLKKPSRPMKYVHILGLIQPLQPGTQTHSDYSSIHNHGKFYVSEFKKVFRNWKELRPDWAKECPELKGKASLDLVTDLINVDMGVLYNKIHKSDPNRRTYGWLPLMARCIQRERPHLGSPGQYTLVL